MRSWKVLNVFVLSFTFWGVSTFAQEKNAEMDTEPSYGIFDTQDEYFQFMGSVKREGQSNPELMAMVPLLNDIVLQQPIGSTGQKYSATSSTLGLLANDDVRKELEIVDEQYDELRDYNKQIQQRVAEELRQLDFSDMKNATAQIMRIRDEAESDLQSTLLPHQMDRLRQILLKNQLRNRSFIELVTNEPWKSKLDISDKQADELKKAEREIEKELQEQMEKLRAKASQKLLSRFNPEQKKHVEEIFGDEILVDRTDAKQKRNQRGKQNRKK